MNQLSIQQIKKVYRNEISSKLENLGFNFEQNYWIKHDCDYPQLINFDIHWKSIIGFEFGLAIRSKNQLKFTNCELYRPENGLLNSNSRTIWSFEISKIKNEPKEINEHTEIIISFFLKEGLFMRFNEIAIRENLINYLQNYGSNHDFLTRHFTSIELLELIKEESI